MVRRGEVYWFDLGEPEGSVQAMLRPVLIVQNNKGNAASPTTIVAAITSQPKKRYPFHVEFTVAESGLKKNDCVLLEQLHTISIAELADMAGSLSPEKMVEVDEALRFSLALK